MYVDLYLRNVLFIKKKFEIRRIFRNIFTKDSKLSQCFLFSFLFLSLALSIYLKYIRNKFNLRLLYITKKIPASLKKKSKISRFLTSLFLSYHSPWNVTFTIVTFFFKNFPVPEFEISSKTFFFLLKKCYVSYISFLKILPNFLKLSIEENPHPRTTNISETNPHESPSLSLWQFSRRKFSIPCQRDPSNRSKYDNSLAFKGERYPSIRRYRSSSFQSQYRN